MQAHEEPVAVHFHDLCTAVSYRVMTRPAESVWHVGASPGAKIVLPRATVAMATKQQERSMLGVGSKQDVGSKHVQYRKVRRSEAEAPRIRSHRQRSLIFVRVLVCSR